MFAEVLHSAMRCLPVTPHANTEFLVNPGPTRIQTGHMTQYDIVKYSIVHCRYSSVSRMGGTFLSELPLIATQQIFFS